MESKVTFREAEQEDVASLEIVRRQAIETGFTSVYDRSDFAELVAEPLPEMNDWIEDDDVEFILAETEFTPICFGAYDMEESVILAFYTAENYREEGHARRLYDYLETQAKQAGNEIITVESPLNAQGFFESLGFEEVERSEREGLEVVKMEKSL
ncbi:MAG: GNAT family N-acetyltransferase [bacterium]